MRSTNFRSVVEPRFQEGGFAQPRSIGTAQLRSHPEPQVSADRMAALQRSSEIAQVRAPTIAEHAVGLRERISRATEGETGIVADMAMSMNASSEKEMARVRRMVLGNPHLRQLHMRQLARQGGPELVEEELNTHARETGGGGGRVVEYSGGALEWVPDGPGGIPQPTTGDVFHDPIADAQQKLEREAQLSELRMGSASATWDPEERQVKYTKGFARGGIVRSESERAYQGGGLAAAVEEEEDLMGPVLPVNEIIARTTGPGPTESLASLATDRNRQIIQTRDDAMARLRAGQKGIAERRARQQQQDESSRWLAFAQGMLAPTRTGGFGESIGTTAGLIRQETELARKHEGERIEEEMLLAQQEYDIEQDFIAQQQAEARLTGGYRGEFSQARPIGTSKLIEHPEDPTKLARAQQIWRPKLEVQAKDADGQPMFDEAGDPIMTTGGTEWQFVDPVGPDGSIPYAASALETERARQLALNKELGAAEGKRINNDIQSGRDAWPMIQKYERAMDLLKQVEQEGLGTGGYVELMQKFAEWWGVDTSEVTTMGQIRHALGQAVLDGLKHFPGQISEGERKYMERLETGLAKPLGVNMGILEEGLRVQRNRLRRGLLAARHVGSPLDLLAMGIDPDAPPGTAAAGSPEGARTQVPGSTRNNPIRVGAGVAMPPAGTWIQLPNNEVRRWKGVPEAEVPPEDLTLGVP